MRVGPQVLIAFALVTMEPSWLIAADWTMFGRDATRNPVSLEIAPPLDWDVGSFNRATRTWTQPVRNVRWKADLGFGVYASPVIADGLVWIGANSRDLENPQGEREAALLRCYRESDGKLLYEYISPRLDGDSHRDPPWHGLACSPSIEGDRLWVFTNRCEAVCLNIAPLKQGSGKPQLVWKTDLKELGIYVRPLWMWPGRMCSVSQPFRGRIYLTLPNGADDVGLNVPAPEAPSLVCLHKDTGEVVWSDNSPGANVLYSEFSSPLVADIGGRGQVVVAQGDGWVRSFDPASGELIWKFDINPKASKYSIGSDGTRNYFLATPVLYEDRIYIGSGRQASKAAGPGRLVCLDSTKAGDISHELAVDRKGNPLPHRRLQAVDRQKGEEAVANPNSGLVWEFTADAGNFYEMQRTLSSVAVHKGLVVAPDYDGFVHCLDAGTGKRHWTSDVFAHVWGSPLIVGDTIYVADDDGLVSLFRLSSDPDVATNGGWPIAQVATGDGSFMSPVFANGTLYVCDRYRLYAIRDDKRNSNHLSGQKTAGHWPQWRGPNRDNVSADSGLLKEWPKDGPPLIWQAEGLGQGIASVSIADGRVFTLGYRDEREYVTTLSETGKQLWMASIGPAVAESPLMRWLGQRTPTIDDQRLYAVRSDGDLVCLHVKDGRELWRKSYVADFGAKRHVWGVCDYPLVDGDKLICSPGGNEATIVALDKKSGEVIWKTVLGEPSSYAAPVVTEGGGRRQYVTFLRNGLVSVAADDGRVLWRYDKLAARHANSATPIVRGDLLLAYNGYDSGRALLKLLPDRQGVKLRETYFHRGWLSPFQDSTLWVGDQIHTFSRSGVLEGYDATTGERNTPSARVRLSISSMTFADGHLVLHNSDGVVSLIEPADGDYVEKSRFTLPDHERAMGATNPVVTGGRLWMRDDNRLFCYDVRQDAAEATAIATVVELQPGSSTNSATRPSERPRSVFVPTPQDVVERMLQLADVDQDDVVYDLGSGDGRIVITAARIYGCRAVGYEIDRDLVELSKANAEKANVAQLAAFERRDIFTVDLSKADVIATYLLPNQLEKLVPQLQQLKPGARVVSHRFEIPGVKPDRVVEAESQEDGQPHKVLLWTAPLKTEKGNQ